MKKVFLSLLVCLTILGSNAMVVNAEGFNMAEALASTMYVNARQVSVRLATSGTNASCLITIQGVSGTESISGTATLTNQTTGKTVASWSVSSSSSICSSQKDISVSKGCSYRLTFSGTIRTKSGTAEHISGSSTASN